MNLGLADMPMTATQQQARLSRQLRERHWTMIWVATAIVGASFLLRVGESGRVTAARWPSVPIPVMCGTRACFGVECPGCGLTRSFVALAAGNVSESLQFHRVGWVIALAVLLQYPYRVYSLWELRARVVERTWPTWIAGALIALLVCNWLGGVVAFW